MSTVHPDDELLSAAIDGDDEAAAAHARACPLCQARTASLLAAARAVAAPVPPVSPEARAAAVTRAVREGRAQPSTGVAPGAHRARRRRLRGWAPVAAVGAAAAVAAAVAIPVVLTRGGPSTLSATRAERAAPAATPAVLDGGDLGSVSDEVALRDAVRQQLAGAAPQSPRAAATPSPLAGQAQPGPPPSSGGPAAPVSGGPPPARQLTSVPQCHAAAEQYGGASLGTLVYAAAVRWQGSAGEVLVFRAGSGSLPYRLFVMARDGCQLLVVQSF